MHIGKYQIQRCWNYEGFERAIDRLEMLVAWLAMIVKLKIIKIFPHLLCINQPWASYQKRKIAGCACAGNAGNVFPRRRFQRKPLVSDPGMHHGTCVTHVPWCMSGSLTCGDGENVPGIPGACAPAILRIWQEAHSTGEWMRWIYCRWYCILSWWRHEMEKLSTYRLCSPHKRHVMLIFAALFCC